MIEKKEESQNNLGIKTNRRQFLKLGGAATIGLMSGLPLHESQAAKTNSTPQADKKPNILFIIADQLGFDAVSAHGCPDVHTPNIDRLVRRGVSFTESHSTNPVCSPARSSLFTGRMPTETGVIENNLFIFPALPTMGQWLQNGGYETVYSGKWHIPYGFPHSIDGFNVLPSGNETGDLTDPVTSRSCASYLKNRKSDRPFLLVASLIQPHDTCGFSSGMTVPHELQFPQLKDHLPSLPPNHKIVPKAPQKLAQTSWPFFSEDQWRYYLYLYYRQVEMVDADIGRILDALEDSGQAKNTIIIFTSDHGDGRGRHMHVQKWFPYDEAVKVPLVVSCPGRVPEGLRDTTHLVSGIDILSTMCDYAGIDAPPETPGKSIRPLVEQKSVPWRDSLLIEVQITGRVIRTDRFKYVSYKGDPIEQLFDMKNDPWETKNLYQDSQYASVMQDHRKLLKEWESRLKPVEPMPKGEFSRFGALWFQPGARLFSNEGN